MGGQKPEGCVEKPIVSVYGGPPIAAAGWVAPLRVDQGPGYVAPPIETDTIEIEDAAGAVNRTGIRPNVERRDFGQFGPGAPGVDKHVPVERARNRGRRQTGEGKGFAPKRLSRLGGRTLQKGAGRVNESGHRGG